MTSEQKTAFDHYDRVTACLKYFSGIDKIPAEILKQACARGTSVHEEIQAIQSNLWIPGQAEHEGYINSYKLWAQDKKFIDNPGRLYDHNLQLTGELDAIYKLSENTYGLVDFKTTAFASGKKLEKYKRIWGMQLSAYTYLAHQAGITISKIELIQLGKSGDFKVFDLTEECEKNWDLYCKCLEIYREFFKGKEIEDDFAWI